MPGAPKMAAIKRKLNDQAQAIYRAIAEGVIHREIAAQVGVETTQLTRWLNHPSRRERYQSLRRVRAQSLVDGATVALAQADPLTIRVAEAQANWAKWLAGRLDPERWGDRPAVAVQVNAGQVTINAADVLADLLRRGELNAERVAEKQQIARPTDERVAEKQHIDHDSEHHQSVNGDNGQ